ncbi:MAG: SPOR domain-containing protein [Rhodospirillales bacterium]|nr:SPOR domain-containing protein [Rhodospirillales bacterium]
MATDDRYAPLVEGPNMLIVRGEDVQEKPLTPEPGDVWADIVPDRKQALAEATPPKVAKGTTPTGVGSAKGAATAITTPLEADWPVAQAAQTAAGQSVPADAMITPPAAPAEGKPPRAADGKVPNAAPATGASSNEAVGPAKPAASGGGKPATLAMGPAAQPAAPVVGKTREHEVQLAAAGSPAEAEAKWAHLAERYPALLRGRSPILRQGEANGRPVWRLRTGGFANGAEASAFCDRLRGAGLSCWVARSI